MVDSPLDSGPVVGTSLHENIAEGYQRLGNVVQEPVKPGVTGEMVLRAGMARAKAMEALANGIDQGLSPLIDKMISSSKEAQAGADYAAGAQAGLAGTTGTGAGSIGAPTSAGSDSQVTRSTDGSLSILPSFSNLIPGGPSKAYAAGHVASENITTANSVAELGTKYAGDPEGFKGAWNAYMQGRNYGSLGPQYGTQATLNAVKYGDETYRNLLAKQTSAGLIASGHAVQTQIDSVSADMSALARGGKLDSPEYAQKQDQLQDLFGQLGENPSFDKANNNLEEKLNQKLHNDIGDHIVGKVDNNYANGRSAAIKAGQDAIDATPGLSDVERQQFLAKVDARIRFNDEVVADDKDSNRKNIEATTKLAAGGQAVDPSAWDHYLAVARRTGDTQSVKDVIAFQQMHPASPMANGLTPAQATAGTASSRGTPLAPMRGASGDPAMIQQIRAGASAAGVDPNLMERIYHGEGAGGYVGDHGSSFGPFQLHMGGLATGGNSVSGMGDDFKKETGFDPRSPSTVPQQIAWVAQKLKEDPSLIRNFHGYSPSNRLSSGAAAAGAAQPLTSAINANPDMAASYVKAVAEDPTVRNKAATEIGIALDTTIKAGYAPAAADVQMYNQLSAGNAGEMERSARINSGAATLGVTGDGGGVGGGGAVGGLAQQPGGGAPGGYVPEHDMFHQMLEAEAAKHVKEQTDLATNHPVTYAVRSGMIQKAPPPINFSDSQSTQAGFQANAEIAGMVSRRQPGTSLSAVPEDIKPQVEAALVSADPQQAVNVLNGIAALPKDARDATIEDMSKAIVGATKSGDPVRMGAAYSLMDQEYRENPMTFDGKFGSGALSDLRKWQEIGQFQTTEKIAKDAMTADDPSTIKARDALKEYAKDKILNTVTGANVVDSLARTATAANPQSGFVNRYNPFGADYMPMSDAPGLVLGALKYDYDQNYKEQYAKTADQPTAEKYALERVGIKWGQSDANGGRFMAYPPERSQALPAIGGDKSWIGKQLGADVVALGSAPGGSHFDEANAAMNLSPQEQGLYQRHLTNLTGPGGVDNPNGSRSTLFQASVDVGGKTYNIPTVWDGKILPPKDALVRAKAEGIETFPAYNSEGEAEARYQQMHTYMEKDTGEFLRGNAIHPDSKEAFLVPDQQTQAEMTSGRVPSYKVATRGTDGSLYVLPKRWAPDPARAQTENAARYSSPAEFQGQPQPPAPWATGVSD